MYKTKENREEKRLIQRERYFGREVLGGLLLLSVAVIFTVMLSARVRAASPDVDAARELSYASYQIQEGDSLWSIAVRYRYAGESTSEFVQHIKRLNGIEADEIHAGSYLLIPTYSYV